MSPTMMDFATRTKHTTYSFPIHGTPQNTIYLLIQNKEVVYVGQSGINFFGRVNEHVKNKSKVFDRVFAFDLGELHHEINAVEHALISYYQPKYNVVSKADVTQKDFMVMFHFLKEFYEYLEILDSEEDNEESEEEDAPA